LNGDVEKFPIIRRILEHCGKGKSRQQHEAVTKEKEKERKGEREMGSNFQSSAGPCLIGRQAWNIARRKKVNCQ